MERLVALGTTHLMSLSSVSLVQVRHSVVMLVAAGLVMPRFVGQKSSFSMVLPSTKHIGRCRMMMVQTSN